MNMKQTNPTGWSDRFDELVLFRRIADGEPIFPKDVDPQMIKVIKSFISSELTATEQKTVERVLESLPFERDGWTNYEKRDLTEWELGHNDCLSAIKSKITSLLTTLSQ